MKPTTSTTRDLIADAATQLFYERGIHRTSVDDAVAGSGFSKPTLYKHFKSKDELVTAGLEIADRRHRARLRALWDDPERSLEDRLLAVFEVLDRWIDHRPGFRGCTLINAAVELPEADHPARRVVLEHKRWVRSCLSDRSRELGCHDPDGLASALLYLLEGATIMYYIDGDRDAGVKAQRAARVLIRAHLSTTGGGGR